jgi:hypothetical protein
MDLTIAWLAQGKLRVKAGDEPPRTIESRFAQGIRDRALRAQQRHSWKAQGEGDKFLASAMLWGRAARDPAAIPITITSLCGGADAGQLLYSLQTDQLCAVLSVVNLGEDELRLWNKNDKRVRHLCVAPDGALACSAEHQFGTANIAVRLDHESGFSDVTEGDSYDTAPRWVPGQGRRLVFQSAGIGRNRHGQVAGLGPFGIQLLEVEGGEMKTLAEDPAQDFLTPQMSADGALYFIRRPYRAFAPISFFRLLKDILFFPFRLAYAIFHYLQFFSMMYTGKKLSSASQEQSRAMDMKEMLVWGSKVSMEKAAKADDAADLVPNSWQLVRRAANGAEEVIAKGVLAYDLAPDGSLVYSNGNAIFLRDPQGKSRRLVVESMIEQLAVVRSGTGPSVAPPSSAEAPPS